MIRDKDGPVLPARQVLGGIFYSLRTGCQLKAVLREYGCGSGTHWYFQEWQAADLFIISRPTVSKEHPQDLCLDAGYTGSARSVEERQYTAHIRPSGEERKEIKRDPNFKARRWAVEATHSFFNRFRKLLVRFEKKAQNYLALIRSCLRHYCLV